MKSLLTALFVFPLVCKVTADEAAHKPNILFISVDDLNDWVGCLGGNPQTKTPNMDRLAASGVLFTNAYCAGASCNPSRTAIMSGRAPHHSGLYENMQKLREVLPGAELMPRYFSRHGYWSAGSGKILHYVIDPPSWDDYFPAKESDNPFPQTFEPAKRPVNLPRAGQWQYGETDWAALDVTDEQYGGDWLVTKWIGDQLQRSHAKPFFLACGIYRPHEPWFVPKKYFEPFPLEGIQPGPGYKAGDVDDLPPAGQKLARNRYFEHIQNHNQWQKGIQAYLASIHYADAMLGRVLDALERSPERDNTIVVMWSDHGWHLGEKEHWQKYTGWRACARVPLIIRVPRGAPGLPEGTTAGSVCTRPVNLVDLYPTLTRLCGLPDLPDISGNPLTPLLRDPSAAWRFPSITHLNHPESFSLSTERWRYIHYQGGDEELYDIQTDPHEWTNLAPKPEHATQLAVMREMIPKNMAPVHESEPGISTFKAEVQLTFVPAADGKAQPSEPSSDKTTVLIYNSRQTPVSIVSLDAAGVRHTERTLTGASRGLLHTFAGQTLWIVDESGKDLGHVVVGNVPAGLRIE
jgi:arylsulfatase A-like enzyme